MTDRVSFPLTLGDVFSDPGGDPTNPSKRRVVCGSILVSFLEARSVIDSTELAQLGALIRAVRAERDSAMSIVSGHEARLSFNFFHSLFRDLPRKAACAGGGAIVAQLNDGKVLIGGLIGLGACIFVEAVFR